MIFKYECTWRTGCVTISEIFSPDGLWPPSLSLTHPGKKPPLNFTLWVRRVVKNTNGSRASPPNLSGAHHSPLHHLIIVSVSMTTVAGWSHFWSAGAIPQVGPFAQQLSKKGNLSPHSQNKRWHFIRKAGTQTHVVLWERSTLYFKCLLCLTAQYW